ncbi:MAG: hypothetical protein ACI85F_001146 [Bacteroidia bacterium]|jgi:hypothetical protein
MKPTHFLSLIALFALGSCLGQKPSNTESSKGDNSMKNIEFGFNTTYLASSPKFEVALEKIANDGFKNVRIYEPFTKQIKKKPELGWNHLNWLKDRGFSVLLSLSNFPYKNEQDAAQLLKIPSKQRTFPQKAIRYSNRFPPADVSGYKTHLNQFMEELKTREMLSMIDFEIGNEPNAPRYFWGDAEDWKRVRNATSEVLSEFGEKGLCCGYTSSMFLQETKERHEQFIADWSEEVKESYQTSFHVYLKTGSGRAILQNPKLDVSGGVITEYGMYSHYTEEKAILKTSAEYVVGLVKLLEFTYTNDIEQVYLFPLMDDGAKKARMGYFDVDGNPKASYDYFKVVWDVLKDGYNVETTESAINVIGEQSILMLAKQSIQMDSNWNISDASNPGSDQLNEDDWIIRDR